MTTHSTMQVGFSTTALRKLSLLLESLVYTDDAWTHCRFIYMCWVLCTAGRTEIVRALLSHLNGLVIALSDRPYPQSRFVQYYSHLEPTHAMKLAADMITYKAEMVSKIQVDDLVTFRLRSLEYDVFWREREQGTGMSLKRALDLLQRCDEVLGPMAVETLTILRILLEDFATPSRSALTVRRLLNALKKTELLVFDDITLTFYFAATPVGVEAATELASIYCAIENPDLEAWIVERLIAHDVQTQSYLRREYSRLSRVSCCPNLLGYQNAKAWMLRKQEIENSWLTEVETVASTKELLAHCVSTQKIS